MPKKRGPKTKLEKAQLGILGSEYDDTHDTSLVTVKPAARPRGTGKRASGGSKTSGDGADLNGQGSSMQSRSNGTSSRFLASNVASAGSRGSSAASASVQRVPPLVMHQLSLRQVQTQQKLEEQQDNLFGDVSFRTSRPDVELPVVSVFPSPSERDLRAIEGFFSHVNNALMLVDFDDFYAILGSWASGRSAAGRHPPMPDHWWCAHINVGGERPVSMTTAAAGVFAFGDGSAPLLRLGPVERCQIALYFAVLAIGFHTIRNASAMPPPDAIAMSGAHFERSRLLALASSDQPNHYLVSTLLLLAHFSHGMMRFRSSSILSSMAWRLARACGLSRDDGGLGSMCTLFRQLFCSDLDELQLAPRVVPGRSYTAVTSSQMPSSGSALHSAHASDERGANAVASLTLPGPGFAATSFETNCPNWEDSEGPPLQASIAIAPNKRLSSSINVVGVKSPATSAAAIVLDGLEGSAPAPCEAMAPRNIGPEYLAAAQHCEKLGGCVLIRGSRFENAAVLRQLDGAATVPEISIALSAKFLDNRLSEVLAVVIARLVLLRRGLLSIESKRGMWRHVDELIDICELPDVAVPLATLANVYGLKSITSRQAGQHFRAQVWAKAALDLWRRVPVTHFAHSFLIGFIARHVALIALSNELQHAALSYCRKERQSAGVETISSTLESSSDISARSAQAPPVEGGISARSSNESMVLSDRSAAVDASAGLPELSAYRDFASIASVFSAVANFWPVHANSYEGLLVEATAMLQGANDSLAKALGVPMFEPPTSLATARSMQSFASAGNLAASTERDSTAAPRDNFVDVLLQQLKPQQQQPLTAGGSSSPSLFLNASSDSPEKHREERRSATRSRPGGDRASGKRMASSSAPSLKLPIGAVASRGEFRMTSLVLESVHDDERGGFSPRVREKAGNGSSNAGATVKRFSLVSPLDLLCMVVRQEQPMPLLPPQPLELPPYSDQVTDASILPLLPLGTPRLSPRAVTEESLAPDAPLNSAAWWLRNNKNSDAPMLAPSWTPGELTMRMTGDNPVNGICAVDTLPSDNLTSDSDDDSLSSSMSDSAIAMTAPSSVTGKSLLRVVGSAPLVSQSASGKRRRLITSPSSVPLLHLHNNIGLGNIGNRALSGAGGGLPGMLSLSGVVDSSRTNDADLSLSSGIDSSRSRIAELFPGGSGFESARSGLLTSSSFGLPLAYTRN